MGNASSSSVLKKLESEEKQDLPTSCLPFLTEEELAKLGDNATGVITALVYLRANNLLLPSTRAACIEGLNLSHVTEMQPIFQKFEDYGILNEKNIKAVVTVKEHAHCMGQVLVLLHIKKNLSDTTRQRAIELVGELTGENNPSAIVNKIPQDDSLPKIILGATNKGSLVKLSAIASAETRQGAVGNEEIKLGTAHPPPSLRTK